MKKTLLFLLAAILGIGACGGVNPIASKPDLATIGSICSSFDRQGHKKLLTPAEADRLEDLAKDETVPDGLDDAVKEYYAAEQLNGDKIEVLEDARRQNLDRKKNRVIEECRNSGWHE